MLAERFRGGVGRVELVLQLVHLSSLLVELALKDGILVGELLRLGLLVCELLLELSTMLPAFDKFSLDVEDKS